MRLNKLILLLLCAFSVSASAVDITLHSHGGPGFSDGWETGVATAHWQVPGDFTGTLDVIRLSTGYGDSYLTGSTWLNGVQTGGPTGEFDLDLVYPNVTHNYAVIATYAGVAHGPTGCGVSVGVAGSQLDSRLDINDPPKGSIGGIGVPSPEIAAHFVGHIRTICLEGMYVKLTCGGTVIYTTATLYGSLASVGQADPDTTKRPVHLGDPWKWECVTVGSTLHPSKTYVISSGTVGVPTGAGEVYEAPIMTLKYACTGGNPDPQPDPGNTGAGSGSGGSGDPTAPPPLQPPPPSTPNPPGGSPAPEGPGSAGDVAGDGTVSPGLSDNLDLGPQIDGMQTNPTTALGAKVDSAIAGAKGVKNQMKGIFTGDKSLHLPTGLGSKSAFQLPIPPFGTITVDLAVYSANVSFFRNCQLMVLVVWFWFATNVWIRRAIA